MRGGAIGNVAKRCGGGMGRLQTKVMVDVIILIYSVYNYFYSFISFISFIIIKVYLRVSIVIKLRLSESDNYLSTVHISITQ